MRTRLRPTFHGVREELPTGHAWAVAHDWHDQAACKDAPAALEALTKVKSLTTRLWERWCYDCPDWTPVVGPSAMRVRGG